MRYEYSEYMYVTLIQVIAKFYIFNSLVNSDSLLCFKQQVFLDNRLKQRSTFPCSIGGKNIRVSLNKTLLLIGRGNLSKLVVSKAFSSVD